MENIHYIWIIISILSTSVSLVCISGFIQKYTDTNIHFLLFWTQLVASIVLLFFTNDIQSALNNNYLWLPLLAIGFLTWLSRILYLYAYSKTTVANVTVFSGLTPIYALCFGYLVGSPLSLSEVIGIIVTSGAIILFFSKKMTLSFRFNKNSFYQAKNNNIYIPYLCAFLSTMPPAISVYIQKSAIQLDNPINVSFFICIISALMSLVFLTVLPSKKRQIILDKTFLAFVIFIGLLQAIATISFSLFISEEHPAIAQSLQRLSSLVQIALAHVFLRQKMDTTWHLFCVSIAIIGIWIITFV